MQSLLEAILFFLAIITPALLASSFKRDTAGHAANAKGTSTYEFGHKPESRWLNKRKRAAAI